MTNHTDQTDEDESPVPIAPLHPKPWILMIIFCSVLLGAAFGRVGWKGRGLAGQWAGPGMSGMLLGILNGIVFATAAFSSLWLILWAMRDRFRGIVMLSVVLPLMFFWTLWNRGWAGVVQDRVMMATVALVGGVAVFLTNNHLKKRASTSREINHA